MLENQFIDLPYDARNLEMAGVRHPVGASATIGTKKTPNDHPQMMPAGKGKKPPRKY
jgi:hypothetical protein